jgi:hypothetical protein
LILLGFLLIKSYPRKRNRISAFLAFDVDCQFEHVLRDFFAPDRVPLPGNRKNRYRSSEVRRPAWGNPAYTNNGPAVMERFVFPKNVKDWVVLPKIVKPGAGQGASGQETPDQRLLKYIPLSIAGAYPLLENAITDYVKSPIAGVPPGLLEWIVFGLLLLWYALALNRGFYKKGYTGTQRWRLQSIQTAVSWLAFAIWTYSIKSAIWVGIGIYNAALAVVAVVVFVLFASFYAPTVNLDEAQKANMVEKPVEPPSA